MPKRKFLSLKDKIDIIAASEKYGISARMLAEKYEVGRTQINGIIKKKESWRKLFEEGTNLEQKRKFPKVEGLEIDQVVYGWICKARNKNVAISGPVIKQKALEAAENLKIENFKASNGWLHRFCQRHNITLKSQPLPTIKNETVSLRTNPKTTLSDMTEVCDKLRDIQNFFICNNSELAIDVAQVLLKSECEVFKNKLKNLKEMSIVTHFNKKII